MAKRDYVISIDDVQKENVDSSDTEALLDIFEIKLKAVFCCHARKAWFDLADSTLATRAHVDEYKLTLEKYPNPNAEQWTGTFESKGSKLTVLATLWKD